MSATAAQLVRLRRMVNESDDSNGYTDAVLSLIVETYPLEDSEGVTDPDSDSWVPTYDLNAAAGDVWEEKAAAKSEDYEFGADGHTLKRNQVYEQRMKMARRFRSRRAAQFRPMIREGDPADLESQA